MNASAGACTAAMPYGYQPQFKGIYIATELLVAVMAIIGNLLVCLAVTHNKKLRTVTNYFLVRYVFYTTVWLYVVLEKLQADI